MLTADDEIARVEFDLQDLIRNGGSIETRHDSLVSSSEERGIPGTIDWSVGYFSRRRPNQDLATDGSDANLDTDIKDCADLQDRTDIPKRSNKSKLSYCPPDPEWPSGILNIR